MAIELLYEAPHSEHLIIAMLPPSRSVTVCQPQALIEAKWVTQLLASHSNLGFSDTPVHRVCRLVTGNPQLVGT